jgi:hypothetical protein
VRCGAGQARVQAQAGACGDEGGAMGEEAEMVRGIQCDDGIATGYQR